MPFAPSPVSLTTADDVSLDADLALADGRRALGAVLICHPHPRFGGNRFNHVVGAVFAALPPAGFHALRFDFRAEFGGGVAERGDVVAAIDHLAERFAGLPVHAVGYSFGAMVMLAVDDRRIVSRVAIAPTFGTAVKPPPIEPTLVVTPAYDQFCPPDRAAAAIAGWPDADLEVIAMADHSLVGGTAAVAELVVAHLSGLQPRSAASPRR